MNNDDFVDGLRNHNPDAAQHLQECCVPSTWRFVYFRVDGDQHLAEDIVSDAVLALVTAIDKGVQVEHPMAWLRSVANRRIQDHYRAAARVAHLMEKAAEGLVSQTEQTPATEHADKLRRQEIRDVLDQLPEQYRMVLEWKYADRVSVREMARRLGATEKATESILFRARKVFKEQMQRLNRVSPQDACEAGTRSQRQCTGNVTANNVSIGENSGKEHCVGKQRSIENGVAEHPVRTSDDSLHSKVMRDQA